MRTRQKAISSYLLIMGLVCLLVSGCGSVQLPKLSADNANTITEIATLQGHNDGVNVVVFSPDGTLLASGDASSSIRLWDVKQEKELKDLEGPTGNVSDMVFHPDGKTIVAISSNFSQDTDFHKLRQWDVKTYTESSTFANIDWSEKKAAVTRAIAITQDGEWIALNMCESPSMNNSGSIVCGIAGIVLVDVGGNNSATDSSPVCPIGSGTSVWGTTFNPEGTLVAASGGGDVVICNFDSQGAQVDFKQEFDFRVFGVAFSPDGKTLAMGMGDNTVRLFDVATEKELAVLEGHTEPVISVAFSPDGNLLASGSVDKTVRVWNIANGETLTTLQGHTDYVVSVSFSPDGSSIASGSYDNTVRLWGLP